MLDGTFKKILLAGLTVTLFLVGSIGLSADQVQMITIQQDDCRFCLSFDSTGVIFGRGKRSTIKAPADADVVYRTDSQGLVYLSVNQTQQAKAEAPSATPPQVIRIGFGKNWF